MKYLVRVPIKSIVGTYGAHKIVYESVDCPRPLWRRFLDHALVLADHSHASLPSKPYDPSPQNGMRVHFDLLANVSVDKASKDGGRQRVDPILQAWIDSGKKDGWQTLGFDVGSQWLEARQGKNGFVIQKLDVANYSTLEFVRQAMPVRIGTVAFSGVLQIADAEKFRDAMTMGIGHSRAWGCGLLLCKRI